MLNLTWSEIGFSAFLFLIVYFVGYLPRIGDFIGDVVHGFRSEPEAEKGSKPKSP